MPKAMATIRHGQVEFDSSIDWPDGMRVEVAPHVPTVGMNESEWPTNREGIAALLERMDDSEPLDLSDEEIAAWEARRLTDKETQKELTRQSWQQAEQLF